MAPVLKTYGSKCYGGFVSKRKGLPKYVSIGSQGATDSVFSALHIDKLKQLRVTDVKHKTKAAKASVIAIQKPTFDDSLNTTFDKLAKGETTIADISSGKPSEKDSSFEKLFGDDPAFNILLKNLSNQSPSIFHQMKKRPRRNKEKLKRNIKFALNRSLYLPSKASQVSIEKSPLPALSQPSPVMKHVTTPVASAIIGEGSFDGITSTPVWQTKTVKFSMTVSPIHKELFKKDPLMKEESEIFSGITKELAVPLHMKGEEEIKNALVESVHEPFPIQFENTDVSMRTNKVEDSVIMINSLSECVHKPCPVMLENTDISVRTENIGSSVAVIESSVIECFCKPCPIQLQSTGVSMRTENGDNSVVIETSVVECICKPRPSGYITKRRIWRRNRKTDFNFSVDMFADSNKSVNEIQVLHSSPFESRLVHVTERQKRQLGTSLITEEEENVKEHFSIKSDIDIDGSVVCRLMKSAGNNELNICDEKKDYLRIGHVSNNHSVVEDDSLNGSVAIDELSTELSQCLSMQSGACRKNKLTQSGGHSCDMFLGLSLKDKDFEDLQMFPFSTRLKLPTKESLESVKHKEPLSNDKCSTLLEEPENHDSVKQYSALCSPAQTVPPEIVLRPCFVRLIRCNEQTVAEVTYGSQNDVSVFENALEDESEENISDVTEGRNTEKVVVEEETPSFSTTSEVSEIITEDTASEDVGKGYTPKTIHEESSQSSRTTVRSEVSGMKTTVHLPLPVLGKLDKITVCNSFEMNRQSLQAVVEEGELWQQSLNTLSKKTVDLQSSIRDVIKAAGAEQEIEEEVNQNINDYEEILARCDQMEPLDFLSCYPERMQEKCKKIGEGAYGEVFMYDSDERSTVIKIIPIEGKDEVNGAAQKKFWEIKPEVIVAQELSSLRKSENRINFCDVFNEVQAVRCVRGKYPPWMLDLWHKYDEENGSENDCPDMFGDDQLYIVLELANGGRDLESYTFTTADQAVSAVAQIVFALAVGENEIEFEHRDLHWGNVLVAPSKTKAVRFTLRGQKYKVPTKGVKLSVIDFTMSRMKMPSSGENLFYDFGADEDLFAAQGDYQCDIYRLMRERTRNNWALFEPFTNILWLHYLLDKMCSMVAYRSENTKLHQQAMQKLKNMRDRVLAFSSATEFALSDFFKSAKAR